MNNNSETNVYLYDLTAHIDNELVTDAFNNAKENKKKSNIKRWPKWMGAIAAVLAIALLVINMPKLPLTVSAKAVSEASESRKPERPKKGATEEQYREWSAQWDARSKLIETARTPIGDFSGLVSGEVLSGVDDTNRVWSPVNAYIALAMTAELTGSETQAEILDILGVADTEELRSLVSAVWEQIYEDDGKEISVLANSLWLDDDAEFVQDKMDSIAYNYYASVYQGDLGSEKTNKAMTNWMRNQTGGLLKDRTQKCQLEPEDQVLAIASTIYFQSQWIDQFKASDNTHKIFHAVTDDKEATFMNKKEYHMNYYWGEDYGAVQMHLENGSDMWFILPDEGKTVDDVLTSDEYMGMITRSSNDSEEKSNHKWMKVNLSVPQFDVSASVDLKEALQSVGLTKIFEAAQGNDFSPSIIKANESNDPVYLDSINQDTRVKIDEKGVVAASYIEMNFGAGAAMPPDEIIDFVLDRPFVFAITSSQIPLFIGTVNTPE